MKKRLLLLVLAAAAAMLLTGCGQSQTGTQIPGSSISNSADSSEDVSQTPAQLPENTPDASVQPPQGDKSTGDAEGGEGSSESVEQNETTPDASTSEPIVSTVEPPVSSVEPTVEQTPPPASAAESEPEIIPEPEQQPAEASATSTSLSGTNLTLEFGGGESFIIHMYDNPTANKIAEYVGTAAWQLPIYHFDDYDGWENFQYYDIPRRYDIPDGAQTVTSAKAGAVYYSHPNRIILFYQDATVSTEYTPVGYIDFSQDLVDAVENNPVVEGWGNKLVFIQP